ncbi:MAG: YceI family protein [Bacteroidales bacterium]|nr:YceI family protein [Bacteroidales bacterium]
MKKSILLSITAAFFLSLAGFGQSGSKLVSTKTQIKFFSSTPAEDIQAFNTAPVSTIDRSTGEVVFSVPMQGFEFEKSLMQKHFNNDNFLDTKAFPEARLKAKITNLGNVDFDTDGSYQANVEGELTIKGKTNPISEKGTLIVAGDEVKLESKFDVTLADYGITFVKGKPASNIARTVEVTVQAEYR